MDKQLKEDLKKEKICNYCGKKYTGWGKSGHPMVPNPLRICDDCARVNLARQLGFAIPKKQKEKEETEDEE